MFKYIRVIEGGITIFFYFYFLVICLIFVVIKIQYNKKYGFIIFFKRSEGKSNLKYQDINGESYS